MTKNRALKIIKKAYELFKPIPPKQWIVNDFADGKGRCCAVGHFVRLTSKNPDDFSVGNCMDWEKDSSIRTATKEFLFDIAGINNRPTGEFHQKTPKARVMACLKQILKEEEK